MTKFLKIALPALMALFLVGCVGIDTDEQTQENIQNETKPVYSKVKVPYRGAMLKKDVNGTLLVDFSKNIKNTQSIRRSKKMGLTESIELTNTVFSWTYDSFSTYDKTEGAWLVSGERIVGHDYIYDVNCTLDGLEVLSGELLLTMVRNQNKIGIPTKIKSDAYFKITMDTQGKKIFGIVDTHFVLNKDNTISFKAQLGSTQTLLFDDETTFNWKLDSYKIIKHLHNYENYILEEIVEDPGSNTVLNQYKLSEQKKYSEFFNKNFDEKYYSFSILVDQIGYTYNFSIDSFYSDVIIEHKNSQGQFVNWSEGDEVKIGDIFYITYYNNEDLDFSLIFSKIEKEEVDDIDLSDLFDPSVNFTIVKKFGANENEAEISVIVDDMGKDIKSVKITDFPIDGDIVIRNDNFYIIDILQEEISSGDSFYLRTPKEGQFNLASFSYEILLQDGTVIKETVNVNLDLGECSSDNIDGILEKSFS